MKKFLIVVLAACFCLAFALPAMAVVKVGGMITTDVYYHDLSKEAQAGGIVSGGTTDLNGYSETQINLPLPYNRLNARFNTDDNVLIGFIELRQGAANVTKSGVIWNYGWLMWQVSPALRLMIGRQTQAYSIGNPAMSLGFDDGHNLAAGFNYVGAASTDAIRAYIRFTDNARLELQMIDPRNDNSEIIAAFPGEAGLATGNEENTIPEFQAALPLTFGIVYLEPSVLYQKVQYDQVASGSDDNLDRYGLCLLWKVGFGMINLSGEIEYDQNVMNPAFAYIDAAGNYKVDDAKSMYAWINLGIKFGASTLNLAVGAIDGEYDGHPDGTTKVEFTDYFYGVSLPISVAKGFTIKPEATYYDYDSSLKIGSSEYNMGTDLVVGVQFQLVF